MGVTLALAIQVKVDAGYICVECGSIEKIQAHHQIKGDDNSMICLCAECHSEKHPELPKALFFSTKELSYWFNKPASIIAKENGVHQGTIIRVAKKLNILSGELSFADEINIIGNLKWAGSDGECPFCEYRWSGRVENPKSCPRCKSRLDYVYKRDKNDYRDSYIKSLV